MPHPLIFLAITVVIATSIVNTISNILAKRRRLENLQASFGKPPTPNDLLQLESISQYTQYFEANNPSQQRVDAITWNDLDMDRVFNRINVCQTSVGEEYLYHVLHELPLNSDALARREDLIQFFHDNPELRLKIQHLMGSRLEKENYNGLTSLMFAPTGSLLKHRHIYTALAILPILLGFVLFISVPIGVIGMILSFVVNMIIHYRTKRRIAVEIPSIKYLTSLLRCCKGLRKIKEIAHLPIMQEIKRHHKTLKSIQRKVPAMTSMTGDIAETFLEYGYIMFLSDIRNYNKFMKTLKKRSEDFHALYRAFGELELSICLLSFRQSLPVYTLPEFTAKNTGIEFTEIYHPLISAPVTNSGLIDNCSLITGSNASGKSTFIKALAINGILAQTINTCAAKSFKSHFALIMTSMVTRDDLTAGDSYFVVEIKSLKRILGMVKKYPCICYIDEILRGTNTIERIAASASVLSYLHSQNALCVAASHDIELTSILKDIYVNYHFSEQITDSDINFDYKLKNGPSTTRNAIKLLSYMGFPEQVVASAEGLAYMEHEQNS